MLVFLSDRFELVQHLVWLGLLLVVVDWTGAGGARLLVRVVFFESQS